MNIGEEITKGKKSYRILDIFRGRKTNGEAKKYAKLVRKNYGYRIRVLSNKDGTIHYVAMELEHAPLVGVESDPSGRGEPI